MVLSVFSASPLCLLSNKVFMIRPLMSVVWGRSLGNCGISWPRLGQFGLGYQPGALEVRGSNPRDPTRLISRLAVSVS